MTKKWTKQDIAESRDLLDRILPENATVYTIVESVSRSGMSRQMRIVVWHDGQVYHPTHAVACVLGATLRRLPAHDTIRVEGCGMDMGWHLVDVLSRTLGRKLRHEWL